MKMRGGSGAWCKPQYFWENAESSCLEICPHIDFSPVCIFVKMISTKKTATKNFHSSVTLKWFGRLPNTLNYFVHWWQEKVFSPLCTLIQILRMFILLNDFVHRKTLDVDVHSRLQKVTQHTKWFCALKAVVGILIRVYSFHVVNKDTFLWKPCFPN